MQKNKKRAIGRLRHKKYCILGSCFLREFHSLKKKVEPMPSERIVFDISGGESDSHKVPVSILIAMLSNLESLFYLMANEDEGFSYSSRLKISEDTRKKYKFLCETPKEGSYSLPIEVESPPKTGELFYENEPTVVKFKNLLTKNSSVNVLYNKYFRTHESRLKATTLTRAAFPREDSPYNVRIFSGSGEYRDSRLIQNDVEILIKEIQYNLNNVPNFSIVSGYLRKIDLAGNLIELSYPPTHRTFKCYYQSDEIEESILRLAAEDKDRLLQISGDLILDKNDEPKKLSNISSVNSMDETPIEISYFERENKRFSFREPVRFVPHLDESKQLYILEYPKLGVDISVYTREDLKEEIEDQIVFLWEEYAKEDDDKLTVSAIELKRNINSFLTVEEL